MKLDNVYVCMYLCIVGVKAFNIHDYTVGSLTHNKYTRFVRNCCVVYCILFNFTVNKIIK